MMGKRKKRRKEKGNPERELRQEQPRTLANSKRLGPLPLLHTKEPLMVDDVLGSFSEQTGASFG